MLKPKDIKSADYNPRGFEEENKIALGTSMGMFGEISGITFNERTGNLVTGHHRWYIICQKHGIGNLELLKISGTDKYDICNRKGETIGYTIRAVDWDLEKEKLANITANSETTKGYFTNTLKELLSSVTEKNKKSVDKLRLGAIKIPKVKVKKKETPNIVVDTGPKSQTCISGSGEIYKTLRMELTTDTFSSFKLMLETFTNKGDSPEDPLKRIVNFMLLQDPEYVTNTDTTKLKQ